MADSATRVKLLCEIAAALGPLVDMHGDKSDDPLSRYIETLAFEAQRLGLQARVNGSDCTSMHSMDSYCVSQLMPLIALSSVSVITNPLINITLLGWHDGRPARRLAAWADANRSQHTRWLPRLPQTAAQAPGKPNKLLFI